VKATADTGLIVAFVNRTDRFHPWAMDIAKSITEPLLTCEAVLTEAAFHLRSATYVLYLIEDGMLRIAFEMSSHQQRLVQLAERYKNRNPDLADLCVIRMSELFPRHSVITVDEADFRIYRRNGRETIPILCPTTGSRQ
jgi:hypothetical protein